MQVVLIKRLRTIFTFAMLYNWETYLYTIIFQLEKIEKLSLHNIRINLENIIYRQIFMLLFII